MARNSAFCQGCRRSSLSAVPTSPLFFVDHDQDLDLIIFIMHERLETILLNLVHLDLLRDHCLWLQPSWTKSCQLNFFSGYIGGKLTR